MTVIEYVTEEVSRQGHDTDTLDGIERVAWMLTGWRFAINHQMKLVNGEMKLQRPTVSQIITIGRYVEPQKNQHGLRTVGVRVGTHICPPPAEAKSRLMSLVQEHNADPMEPLDFYRKLLEIHPFVDGNGRTGKIVLNWLNHSLFYPIFPPADFWGHPIRNP